jgi:hypothetical protein
VSTTCMGGTALTFTTSLDDGVSVLLFEREVVWMTQKQREIKRMMQSARVRRGLRQRGQDVPPLRNLTPVLLQLVSAYECHGEAGLVNRRPCPENHSLRTPAPIEERIVHLRLTYHFGPTHLAWYLGRYHGFSSSTHGVYNVLVRNGINRLPTSCHKGSMPSMRYQKHVPGHDVQVDVKFLNLVDESGHKVRRFLYTAIDDATRIRALGCMRSTPRLRRSTSSTMLSSASRFASTLCRLRLSYARDSSMGAYWTTDMSSRPSSTGTSKTKACSTSTPSRRAPTGTGSRALPTRSSSTSCSATPMMLTWPRSSPPGKSSTASTGPTAGSGGLTPYGVLKEKMAS